MRRNWFSGVSRPRAPLPVALGALFFAVPALAYINWFDTTAWERQEARHPISSRTYVEWDYANKSAEAVCHRRGYEGGLYTGHQSGDLMGINCSGGGSLTWMDMPGWEARTTKAWLDYSRTVRNPTYLPHLVANGAAMDLCKARGYGGGFFNGHYDGVADVMGAYCAPTERTFEVSYRKWCGQGTCSQWWSNNIDAEAVCIQSGGRIGVVYDRYTNPVSGMLAALCIK